MCQKFKSAYLCQSWSLLHGKMRKIILIFYAFSMLSQQNFHVNFMTVTVVYLLLLSVFQWKLQIDVSQSIFIRKNQEKAQNYPKILFSSKTLSVKSLSQDIDRHHSIVIVSHTPLSHPESRQSRWAQW